MQRLLQLLRQLVLQPWLLPMSGEELRGSGRGLPVRSAWDVPGCKAQVLMLLSRPSRLAAHLPTYHPTHTSQPPQAVERVRITVQLRRLASKKGGSAGGGVQALK